MLRPLRVKSRVLLDAAATPPVWLLDNPHRLQAADRQDLLVCACRLLGVFHRCSVCPGCNCSWADMKVGEGALSRCLARESQ